MKVSKLMIIKRICVGVIVVAHIGYLDRIPSNSDFYTELIKISISFVVFTLLNAIAFHFIEKLLSRK